MVCSVCTLTNVGRIFFIFMQFLGKFDQILGRRPSLWVGPLLGNPRSAADLKGVILVF